MFAYEEQDEEQKLELKLCCVVKALTVLIFRGCWQISRQKIDSELELLILNVRCGRFSILAGGDWKCFSGTTSPRTEGFRMPRCLSVFDIGHGSEAEWVTHGYGVRPNGVVPARQNSASLPECFEGLTKQLSALGDVFLMLAPARVSIAQSQFEEAEENSMCW